MGTAELIARHGARAVYLAALAYMSSAAPPKSGSIVFATAAQAAQALAAALAAASPEEREELEAAADAALAHWGEPLQ